MSENQDCLMASRLREAMAARGMRQVDLVEKTGLSKSLINQYLSERVTNIRGDKLTALAKALSVDEAWLFGYGAQMKGSIIKPEILDEFPELLSIVTGYPNAPNSVREAVSILLKPYADNP